MTESETVEDFHKAVNADQGVTGGAVMRAAPFGLLPDINLLKTLSIHFLYYGGHRSDLSKFLEVHLGNGWSSTQNGYGEEPNNDLKIVTQALNALEGAQTYTQILLKAVNQVPLSDTDTVCALALILASRCQYIENDLPATLYQQIDNGPYGVNYLDEIDSKLVQAYPKQKLY